MYVPVCMQACCMYVCLCWAPSICTCSQVNKKTSFFFLFVSSPSTPIPQSCTEWLCDSVKESVRVLMVKHQTLKIANTKISVEKEILKPACPPFCTATCINVVVVVVVFVIVVVVVIAVGGLTVPSTPGESSQAAESVRRPTRTALHQIPAKPLPTDTIGSGQSFTCSQPASQS